MDSGKGFLRFSGWMLLLSGIITTIVQYIHLEDVPESLEQMDYFVDFAVWTHIFLVIASAMFLMGFSGLYIRQAKGLKWWGWLSYCFLALFFVLDMMHSAIQIFTYPVFFEHIQNEEQLTAASDMVMKIYSQGGPGMSLMMLLTPLMLAGTLLMGISMLKCRILSKWPAIFNLATIVLILLPYGPITKFLFPLQFLIYAWYGAILVFEKHNEMDKRPDSQVSING